MKATMTILKDQIWQQMSRKAHALMGRSPLFVGVDWGSRLIKAVVLQADGNGLALHDFSIHSVDRNSLQDERSNVELIETMKNKITAPFGVVGTSLSGPSVFMKTIALPIMTEDDLREHLTLELDRYIALDTQDVFWDVYYRKSLSEGTPDRQEHFLIIAKKECVKRQMDTFSQCGATVRFVDVDAFALINLVTFNYGKKGTWLLADIGPTGILMVVIVQGEPAYIRKVAYETEWYEDLLDQVLLSQTSLDSKKELSESEAYLLEQFIQETSDKICDTLVAFSEHSTTVVDRGVLLSGGYAAAPEMAVTLAPSLRMPVQLLNPFQSIVVPQAIQQDPIFQQVVPLMNVAVGVALRGALTHD